MAVFLSHNSLSACIVFPSLSLKANDRSWKLSVAGSFDIKEVNNPLPGVLTSTGDRPFPWWMLRKWVRVSGMERGGSEKGAGFTIIRWRNAHQRFGGTILFSHLSSVYRHNLSKSHMLLVSSWQSLFIHWMKVFYNKSVEAQYLLFTVVFKSPYSAYTVAKGAIILKTQVISWLRGACWTKLHSNALL